MSKRFKQWSKPEYDMEGWAYPNKVCANMRDHPYGWRCQHFQGLKLGKNVDIGCFTYMNAKYGIIIEDDVQIGSHCSIYSHNTENNTHAPIMIGKGSLIGSHCLILPNSIIKPDSKIRAFSIVDESGIIG